MIVRVATSLFLAMAFSAGLVSAENEDSWQPAPPMPDKYDWIQLTSDEWLKGEILGLFDDELEFDSDELDELTFDWEDIKQVRSAQIMQVGFLGHTHATGKLLVDGDKVRVIGDEDRQFERSQVFTITPGEPKERNYWSGKASLGANVREGNTDQADLTSKLNIQRRTIERRLVFDYLANFSTLDGEDTINNQRSSATFDNFINDRFYLTPGALEYFRDPFQNISQRGLVRVGVGYQLVDNKKIEWRVSGGPAYQKTWFESVADGEDDTESTASLALDTFFDAELTKWFDFVFDYRISIVNERSGGYTHHMEAIFETELTKRFDFDVSFLWDHTQNPQPDADDVVPEQNDVRLIVSVGWEF